MTNTLAVWLGGDRVGDLISDRRGLTFRGRPGTARLTVAPEGELPAAAWRFVADEPSAESVRPDRGQFT